MLIVEQRQKALMRSPSLPQSTNLNHRPILTPPRKHIQTTRIYKKSFFSYALEDFLTCKD